jgi:hypothetical protein
MGFANVLLSTALQRLWPPVLCMWPPYGSSKCETRRNTHLVIVDLMLSLTQLKRSESLFWGVL